MNLRIEGLKMRKKFGFFVMIFILIENCATFMTSTDWDRESKSKIYSGTIWNTQAILSAGQLKSPWLFLFPLAIVDFPFSLIADTIVLPYTSYLSFENQLKYYTNNSEDEKKIREFNIQFPSYIKLMEAIYNKEKEEVLEITKEARMIEMTREIETINLETKNLKLNSPINLNLTEKYSKEFDAILEVIYKSIQSDPELRKVYFKNAYSKLSYSFNTSEYSFFKESFIWKENHFKEYLLKDKAIRDKNEKVFSILVDDLQFLGNLLTLYPNEFHRIENELLTTAFYGKQMESFEFILNHIVDAKDFIKDSSHLTFLIRNPDVLKILLNKKLEANMIYKFNGRYTSLLIEAIEYESLESVNALLKMKANPNLAIGKPDNLHIPLHTAIRFSKQPKIRNEIIQALLNAGADKYKRDNYNQTPFNIAQERGDMKDVEKILE